MKDFPYSALGIEKHSSADNGKGDLSRIAQGLECARRDVQIAANLLAREVTFIPYRGTIVVLGLLQRLFRLG